MAIPKIAIAVILLTTIQTIANQIPIQVNTIDATDLIMTQ